MRDASSILNIITKSKLYHCIGYMPITDKLLDVTTHAHMYR